MFAINTGPGGANTSLGCLTGDTGGLPLGNIETAVVSGDDAVLTGGRSTRTRPRHWRSHAYVNGGLGAIVTANGSRPDVGSTFPGAGSAHGFTVRAPLQAGSNQVCIFAINVPTPAVNPATGLPDARAEGRSDRQLRGCRRPSQ
jgi:hypothetical protein